ncbi:MAG: BlaI/MecI/CopY family transcriptional regulator [Saprospiraceae bacterium]|jgi:predicted transcriptional regulator|nr:BlaI/MecI/CopY family transcriptional regulator [Saprospiraceae bacterium]
MSDKKYQPTESELEILQVLWANEPCTVRFIFEQLSTEKDSGYTTVLVQLQRMTKKGLVSRYKEGKTHYYQAIPKEEEIQENLFKRLVKTAYKGSAMDLALHALGQAATSEEELAAIQKWLDQKKNEQK